MSLPTIDDILGFGVVLYGIGFIAFVGVCVWALVSLPGAVERERRRMGLPPLTN